MLNMESILATLWYNITCSVMFMAIAGTSAVAYILTGLYHKTSQHGEKVDWIKLGMSFVRVLCVFVATILLTVAISLIPEALDYAKISVDKAQLGDVTNTMILLMYLGVSVGYIKKTVGFIAEILDTSHNKNDK